jgi:hypothetical protein
MERKNLSQCFDLLALAFVGLVMAVGCAAPHHDHGGGRGRLSALSASSQADKRPDTQKLQPMPKPARQKAR